MHSSRRLRSRGSSIVEFTFVGIPLIFVLISIFEGARGMWIYTNMAHAIKEGTRYTTVNGYGFKQNCLGTAPADVTVCQVDVRKVAQAILDAGPGLVPADVTNISISINGTVRTCTSLATCISGGAGVTWSDDDLTPGSTVAINARYQFANAISMFWPGASGSVRARAFALPANSQDLIQY